MGLFQTSGVIYGVEMAGIPVRDLSLLHTNIFGLCFWRGYLVVDWMHDKSCALAPRSENTCGKYLQ